MNQQSERGELARRLNAAVPGPNQDQLQRSRSALRVWFQEVADKVLWTRLETHMGSLMLFKRADRLTMIAFGSHPDDLEQADFSLDLLVRSPQDFQGEIRQLQDYFAGTRAIFDVDLSLEGMTDFQRQVLMTTAEIPFGQTLSYAQVARRIGRPKSSRAVGQALARNPIPVVIPCHRVISSSGGLGGYAGGLAWKRKLLVHEGALAL